MTHKPHWEKEGKTTCWLCFAVNLGKRREGKRRNSYLSPVIIYRQQATFVLLTHTTPPASLLFGTTSGVTFRADRKKDMARAWKGKGRRRREGLEKGAAAFSNASMYALGGSDVVYFTFSAVTACALKHQAAAHASTLRLPRRWLVYELCGPIVSVSTARVLPW